jgi:hypothetical protein
MAIASASRRKVLAGSLLVALAGGCAHEQLGPEPAASAVTLPVSAGGPNEPRWKLPPGSQILERNRCIDRELARRNLNEFGDPKGTTYREGAPLEVAKKPDRYEYVLRRRPDIAGECGRALSEPEQ